METYRAAPIATDETRPPRWFVVVLRVGLWFIPLHVTFAVIDAATGRHWLLALQCASLLGAINNACNLRAWQRRGWA